MKQFSKYVHENLDLTLMEPVETEGAIEAKKMGLVHVGFNRYENPETGQVTHIVQGGKLLPFENAIQSNNYKLENGDDFGNFAKSIQERVESLDQQLSSIYVPDAYNMDQLSAIKDYSGDRHVEYTTFLSQYDLNVPVESLQPQSINDDITNNVKALHSATQLPLVPYDFIAYTSIGNDINFEDDFDISSSFALRTFKSVSIHLGYIINEAIMSGTLQPKLLQLTIPKGYKGIYIDRFSVNPGEGEFLLPRGAIIKPTSNIKKSVGSNATTGNDNVQVLFINCNVL